MRASPITSGPHSIRLPTQRREKEQMRRSPILVAVLLLIILAYAVNATRTIRVFPLAEVGTAGAVPTATDSPTAGAPTPTSTPQVRLPSVSIDSVFAPKPPSFAGLDPRKLITLRTTGDVIPA